MHDATRRGPSVGRTLLCAMTAILWTWTASPGQETPTAGVAGTIRDTGGMLIEGARVDIVNRASGFGVVSVTNGEGRYQASGLEVGGPYTIAVRRLGYRSARREGITLVLGRVLSVDFTLPRTPATLRAVVVRADSTAPGAPVATLVSDSTLSRLPTPNRDLYAFVQLAPAVVALHGLSGAGANHLYNSIRIDGASAQAPYGANPAGAIFGGRSIPLDAVREYVVRVAPYDVREGGFAGAEIEAVTKSGGNTLHGSAVGFLADANLARGGSSGRLPYVREQYGASLGGPIVRDRMHFFLAVELQDFSSPSSGPFEGTAPLGGGALRVDTADVTRFTRLLREYGLRGGSAGVVQDRNPTANLFARIDLKLPGTSRLVLRHNWSRADSDAFSRPALGPAFPLSSYGRRYGIGTNATVLQLITNFASGAQSELLASRSTLALEPVPRIREPLISVSVPGALGQGSALLEAGSYELAQVNRLTQQIWEIADNLTLLRGVHRVSAGVATGFSWVRLFQLAGAYGIWHFGSLDSLQHGLADDYRVAENLGGADATTRAITVGVYAGDQWPVTARLVLNLGVRADAFFLRDRPPYVVEVDTLFGRRTDRLPSGRTRWSPRVGFAWELDAAGRTRLRGGTGVFAGRPPLAWLHDAFSAYGRGVSVLHCGTRPLDAGPPPVFPDNPDYRTPPPACRNGLGLESGIGSAVDLVSPRYDVPETLRTSLAVDRQLPWHVVATVEVLYSHDRTGARFVNRNLRGPIGVDRFGRVMYGTIDQRGVASPVLVAPRFSEVIDLVNDPRGYSYAVTAQLDKQFSNRIEARLAYAHVSARDVQSDRYVRAADNWQLGAVLAGRDDARPLGVSDYDEPHRVVVALTYTIPRGRWTTDLSVYYVGASGAPFTYVAGGTIPGAGDLNADGSAVNDPIYVPRSASDSTEIQFAGTPAEVVAQQRALDALIARTPCLRRQRGHLLPRNSCRAPWTNTTNISLRQSLPWPGSGTAALQMDVFNLLDLLAPGWGRVQVPNAVLLTQVGQTTGSIAVAQPVFRFDPRFQRFSADRVSSSYQVQIGLRLGF